MLSQLLLVHVSIYREHREHIDATLHFKTPNNKAKKKDFHEKKLDRKLQRKVRPYPYRDPMGPHPSPIWEEERPPPRESEPWPFAAAPLRGPAIRVSAWIVDQPTAQELWEGDRPNQQRVQRGGRGRAGRAYGSA